MYEMTKTDWIAVGSIGGFILFLIILSAVLGRRETNRRIKWHHDYFYGGGLVRLLINRWNSQPRLTDQRKRDDP